PEPSPVIENVTMPPGLEQLDDPPPLFGVAADTPPERAATARPVTPEDWDAMLAAACEASPISGSMVGPTMFMQDDEGLLYIAIHPEDVNTRDALLSENIISALNEQAQARCGRSITLRIVTDAAVAAPTPVEILSPPKFEEIAPAPKPVQKEAPKQPAEPEKKAATPSLKPTEEEFYQDPLIEQALKTFHATLIKN
ncbi:MAG: hypothetical protein IKL98_03385, partial [Akkermansia sp.]|nr:hypothetical protein [Akkermansia sp.]